MTAHRSIVVATDGSEKAAVATTVAANLTAAWTAQLHVVHAWSPIPRMVATYGTGAGATAVMSPPIMTARTGARPVRARLELAAPVTAIKAAVDSVPGPVLV